MPYTLEIEDLMNKSKEEIEKELYYLTEENSDLRQKINAGKQAEKILTKNECRLVQLMDCYMDLKGEEYKC